MEAACLKGTSQDIINKWFDAVESMLAQHDIQLRDVYNMDETGFSISMIQASCVVIDSQQRTQYQTQPSRQEWVSIVECIYTDGTTIAPLIIFKGDSLSTA